MQLHGVSDLQSDDDRDGLDALLEFFLGSDPKASSSDLLPVATLETIMVNDHADSYLTISFQHQVATDEVGRIVEFSSDLVTWTAGGILVSQTPSGNNDGLVTERWRSPLPQSAGEQQFARLRVQAGP